MSTFAGSRPNVGFLIPDANCWVSPGATMVEPNDSAAERQTDDSRTARMGLLAYPRVIDALDVAAAVETLAASPLDRVRSRGLEFVQDMREDEAFNRNALAKLTLELTSAQGGDVSGPAALKLRNLMKDQSQRFPKPKKLDARTTAADGGAEMAY